MKFRLPLPPEAPQRHYPVYFYAFALRPVILSLSTRPAHGKQLVACSPKAFPCQRQGIAFGTEANVGGSGEVERNTAEEDTVPSIILGSEEPSADVEVENAGAWAAFGATAASSSAHESESGTSGTDFDKFRRLAEQDAERTKLEAEIASRKREDAAKEEQARRKKAAAAAAEAQRLKIEAEKKRAAEAEDAKARAIADRLKEREDARRQREAMTGHVDLHEQSNVMEEFGDLS